MRVTTSTRKTRRSMRRRDAVKLISGALVGVVPLRTFAKGYLSIQQALSVIFPGEELVQRTLKLSAAQMADIRKRSGVRVRDAELETWQSPLGNVVFIDRVLGKHEFITYACGITAMGRVKQIEIIEYRETYGDEIRDGRWRAQFVGKRASDPLKLDDDIRNISGATLSCSHVTDGVKRLLATFEVAIGPRPPGAAAAWNLP